MVPELSPAGESAVRVRGRRWWMRWLPAFFLVLSLGSLAGMAFGAGALAEDGWSVADAVQLALMTLLVVSVIGQFRGVWSRAPFARRKAFTSDPSSDSNLAGEGSVRGFSLDLVSGEELALLRPAALPRIRRAAFARRRGGRAFERFGVIGVVALGALAFVGMVVVCGYLAYENGFGDPALWLTAPFAGLTGFGSWQVLDSARKAAFRGRPLTLVSRAFRDSVRVWGSGSLISRVAMTTTATASVAGAAAAPAIIGPSTPFDLFIVDSGSSALFRVDLATLTSSRFGTVDPAMRTVALGSAQTKLTAPGGQKAPAGSLVAIFEGAGQQRVAAFRPGSAQPIFLAQIEPPIPGANFAFGAGTIYAVQPDGAFWTVEPSGRATRQGQLTVTPGPMAWDGSAKVLLVLSGHELVRVDPVTRSALSKRSIAPEGFEACGVARGAGDRVFVAERSAGELFQMGLSNRGGLRGFEPKGDTPSTGCLMTVARRR